MKLMTSPFPIVSSSRPKRPLRRAVAAALASTVTACLLLTVSTPARAVDLTCERIPLLLNNFLRKHIRFRHLNDELRQRAIETYVKRLDPSKTLYTAAETQALKTSLRGIFFDVGSGECGRLEEIQTDIVLRYVGMKDYIETYVSDENYAVDPQVEIVIDPDKRAHPRTSEQQESLYAKLVHFQMSNYLSTGISLDEAKRKLIHRYELMVKRAKEFDRTDIYTSFLDSFATAMDPHSNYLSAEVLEDFQIQMGLSLDGIGVKLSSRDGYSVVEDIIPGGAADRVNQLVPKDKVIAVAQKEGEFVDVIDMDLRKVVRLIRGERGTTVRLSILRQAPSTERFVVDIVRDKINLDEQAAQIYFEDIELDGKKAKLAVIDLPSFYGGRDPTERQSSTDLRRLLEQANEAGAVGLLLDLSRNGGGLLETARDISGYFIREGGIVAVKDDLQTSTFDRAQVLRDDDPKILFDGPMVVLTSRISASASEIVAGAMKDYRRAIIVGDDHTFGKGTVQTMVPLPPGLGALKVTTALFFRPGGRSTQHSGVDSDIVMPSLFNTDDFGEANQTYSLESATIDPFLDGGANLNRSTTDETAYYAQVTPEVVAQLAALSAERVAASEDFAEVTRKLDESKERGGVIRLSEILKENDQKEQSDDKSGAESDAESDDKEVIPSEASGDEPTGSASETGDSASASTEDRRKRGEDEEPSIQRSEALHILEDYVRLSHGSLLVAGEPVVEPQSATQ
jgi:carboxyl-terminal processing protease